MKRCPQCNRVETDESLKFCRVDGTVLFIDSSLFNAEGGTAKLGTTSAPTEIETSILPHTTDSVMHRVIAPPTVLPAQPLVETSSLGKPKRRGSVIALIALAAIVVAIGGYFYFSRKSNASIQSIAVMPFINEGGNADAEYLSDGMTEALISSLSQLPNLKVKARSSVFRYQGKQTSPQTIGKELNVQAVLNGRVTQRGDQLMLTLELVDAQTENVIWGEQYNRRPADLVTLQSEIARDVSSKLESRLSGADQKRLAKSYTTDPEAYQHYLKGRFYWNKRTADGLKQSVDYYHQAIEKDPAFALAYSGLAEAYVLFSVYSVALPKDSMPTAKAAALKALAIDDSLAEPHAALGLYYSNYGWDPAAAERELRRAIELKPNYATAYHWLGDAPLLSMGRFDEAVAAGRRAAELDPLSPVISADTAYILISARRYDDAIAQGQRALLLDPNFYYTHYILGLAYYEKGMYAEAISECRRSLQLNPDPFAKATLALALSKSGGRAEAVKLRDELKAETARRYVPGYFLAIICGAVGDKDEAFKWLEKDFTERAPYLVAMPVDPAFDDLRTDQRFAALRERVATAKLD